MSTSSQYFREVNVTVQTEFVGHVHLYLLISMYLCIKMIIFDGC